MAIGGVDADSSEVHVVETFCYFAQLTFIFLVVKGGSNRFDRLVPFCLAILRHQEAMTDLYLLYVVERFALDDLLLQQKVIVSRDGVVHVGL